MTVPLYYMIGTLLLSKAAHYAMVQIQVLEAWLAPGWRLVLLAEKRARSAVIMTQGAEVQ